MPNNFFGPSSPYLNHPLLTTERTTAEVDHLVSMLGLTAGDKTLDVGCGFGRHSVELAKRGMAPTGVDPSATMIEAAQSAAAIEGVDVSFLVGAGEQLGSEPLAQGPYRGAIAMFTTLGQVDLSTEPVDYSQDNRGLVEVVAPLLAPGAKLVLELPQRDAASAALVTTDKFGSGDNGTEISRSYDPAQSLVVERFDVVADGQQSRFDLAYRLFSAHEVTDLLDQAGFVDVGFASTLADLAAMVNTGRLAGPADLDPEAVTMYAIASAPDLR